MKMNTQRIRMAVMLLLSVLLAPLTSSAQNVTVEPTTGKLIAAATRPGEAGFEKGWSSLWKHEQLGLTFTVADDDLLSDGGEISNPACNMNVNNGYLIIAGGPTPDSYSVLSLPKGYRITGYRMVILNNLNHTETCGLKVGSDGQSNLNVSKVMYETDSSYDISNNNFKARAHIEKQEDQYTMGGATSDNSDTREYILERHAKEEDGSDMGNQLYFRLHHTTDAYYAVTIKSFEVWFTAEGTFKADVVPEEVGAAKSMVMAPFVANKTDIGAVTKQSKDGTNFFYAYNYKNVQDVNAYTYLYQQDAIQNNAPADVAANKHISPVMVDDRMLYALGNDTYYIETPVSVTGQTGISYPIGYRITGARFNYLWGTKTDGGEKKIDGCVITGKDANNRPTYLNEQLQFTTTRYVWIFDDLGNICTHNGKRYLACYGDRDQRELQFSTKKDNQYNLKRDSQGRIYYISGSGTYYYLQYYNGTYYRTYDNREYYLWNGDYASYTPMVVKSTNAYNASEQRWYGYTGCYRSDYVAGSTVAEDHTISYPAFNPGSYTLTVYGKEGGSIKYTVQEADSINQSHMKVDANGVEPGAEGYITTYEEGYEEINAGDVKSTVDPVFTKKVNSAADAGYYDLTGLNNDAVKFSISGLIVDDPATTDVDESTQALVSVTLTMEALNPYIDKMNIVCHDPNGEMELSQEFTASNFMVSGGEFVFYIPKEYENTELKFSFSDLYSGYGDETYTTGSSHKGRYSFVTSDYFTPINENGNDGLYDAKYDPDADCESKIVTTSAGNVRFRFNNADELVNTGGHEGTNYLYEYPFSVANYLASTDPDGSKTPEFSTIKLKAGDTANNSGTYYVFTADETRYNIAPTKAWQHRSYAFYRMGISLVAKNYTPDLTWTKVYDKTCYINPKTNAEDYRSMWGLTLKTKDGNTIVDGYLTAKQIDDAITADITNTEKETPESADQILYVDGSELHSIINSTYTDKDENNNDVTVKFELKNLMPKLATNSLFYLPENTTSTENNFAYKKSGVFYAGKNIVLTDRNPFFAPYDIQVNSPNVAIHERQISKQTGYNTVTTASLILPFDLLVETEDEEHLGEHTNAGEETPAFRVHEMDNTKAIVMKQDKNNPSTTTYYAYFPGLKNAGTTDANTPYLVEVLNAPAEATNLSFVASQTGALIKATTKPGTYTGEASSGTISTGVASGSYTFTPTGTYAGQKVNKSSNIFYFAQDNLVCSKNLSSISDYVKIYPFRFYYATGDVSFNVANRLGITFELEEDDVDAIGGLEATKADMVVRSDCGTLTITSAKDNNVRINNLSGISYGLLSLKAGETKTVNVPAGIYVVNGVKILVK